MVSMFVLEIVHVSDTERVTVDKKLYFLLPSVIDVQTNRTVGGRDNRKRLVFL